jgi:hypothetical protein
MTFALIFNASFVTKYTKIGSIKINQEILQLGSHIHPREFGLP